MYKCDVIFSIGEKGSAGGCDTVLHTCSFTQPSPRETSSQYRLVEKVCCRRASLHNLLMERRPFVALGAARNMLFFSAGRAISGKCYLFNKKMKRTRWKDEFPFLGSKRVG